MSTLAIVDVQDGHVRRRIEVATWPLTIGRALDNDVVLDDPHVAAHHATLNESGRGLELTVGDSRNGARLGRRRIRRGETAPWTGDTALHLGHAVLRVRLASTPLAPERPFRTAGASPLTALLLCAALLAFVAEGWLDFNGTLPWWRAVLPALLAQIFVLATWVAGWALVSKLFSRRSDLARHLRVASAGVAGFSVFAATTAGVAFAFDWPAFELHSDALAMLFACAVVYAHLHVVSPARPWLRAFAVGVPGFAALALVLLARYNDTGRLSGPPYMSTVLPPGLRAAPAEPLDRFLGNAADLRRQLDRDAADPDDAERDFSD